MSQEKYEISIVVGAGAARRRCFVYNAVVGTGPARLGTALHSLVQMLHIFGSIDKECFLRHI